jgi:vancomycin resistance protein YoaR
VDGRTKNISISAGKLDGVRIEPKAVLNFNEVVGIRSSTNGYKEAPVLLEGRRVDDLGGGVCQVSSTLHAAALHGHLTIKERYPHTLVPKYIHAGYDATVAFPESCEQPGEPCGKLNLKIENPYDAPVTIRTEITEMKTGHKQLTVRLEGVTTDCTHAISYWSKPLDRGVQRMVRSTKILNAKYVKKVQQAAAGMVIWSSIVWKCPGKPDEPVRWFSRYPPVDEVWEVGWKRPRDERPPWESSTDQGGAPG